MKEKKKYYLGLDIGTNSVGWAVTTPEYDLCRFKGKDMWGIRLFESGDTAAERRASRANRRRLKRRTQRLNLLQELFASEVSKIDDSFFVRLNESKLHVEDKSTGGKYPLFIDDSYNDVDYYNEYPTIFHLRKELVNSKEPHDARLVYLAIHNILKYRGHFLIEGGIGEAKNFDIVFNNLIQQVREIIGLDLVIAETDEIERILKDKKLNNSTKAKLIEKEIGFDTAQLSKDEQKITKGKIKNICTWMCGLNGDIAKVLPVDADELEKTKFKFSEASYEETVVPDLESKIPDGFQLIAAIKAVYDWSVLVDILAGKEYLSEAKVAQYDEHARNLKSLKGLIKKYLGAEAYNAYFSKDGLNKSEKGLKYPINYAYFIGEIKHNGVKKTVTKCKKEDFYKSLKKVIEEINPDDSDKELVESIMAGIEKQSLFPMQRDSSNSVIPHQVHLLELEKILENASSYLAFLNGVDEDGISISEKIKSLLTFRIPYYVGPLSNRHKEQGANVWIKRKEEGYIYPWNFEKKVDSEASNQEFILRMTNKCTYLIGEDVLPKQSLLYSKFMVLNELNNLKIRGNSISVDLKQSIYNDLFMRWDKVTGKRLLDYLVAHQDSELTMDDLSGFDVNFKASMKPYLDVEKKLFGNEIQKDAIRDATEDIIKWKTIFGKDNKMVMSETDKKYPGILKEVSRKNLKGMNYSGWGALSKKMLAEIEGASKENGEVFTIIEALWNTNDNLMQLLSDRYTFKEAIDSYNKEQTGEITEISYDALVRDLYTSPANKRAIWQTVQIAEEIKKVMGCPPEKIFVEMARGGEKEKKRTTSRKERLLALYAACEKDTRDWVKEIEAHDERDFNSMKLYLYYTQQGKCMYSGEEIDLKTLMTSNSNWDRDHIYPQSKIKDDSIDNLVLVNKKMNIDKSNDILPEKIRKSMSPFWRILLAQGLISKKKFDRLMRNEPFNDDELAGFIARQMVETRQSTKAVAELLDKMYEDTSVVYVKAGLVSDFRKRDLNRLKSRRVNDYHHAKDAYLNIVVGNVYNTRFTSNPYTWIKKNKNSNYSISKVFRHNVNGKNGLIWERPIYDGDKPALNENGEIYGGTIDKIRSIVDQNNILHTEYSYIGKGQLFDATIYNKDKGATIPLKADLDPSKYGGFISPKTAYFALVEFDGKKGERARQIIEVPIYIAARCDACNDSLIDYLSDMKGMKNVEIKYAPIKKNALMKVDGFPMRIRGANERDIQLKAAVQLVVDRKIEERIRRIEKYLDKGNDGADCQFDGFTESELIELYDLLIGKLSQTIYSKRPANYSEKLKSLEENFIEIDLGGKAYVINEVLSMLRCDINTTANLEKVGGGSSAGNIAINKNSIGKKSIIMFNQSVTGLFEKKVVL